MELASVPTTIARRTASLIRATPLEGPARALRRAWWNISGRIPQHERYDRLTAAVIARVASADSNFVDVGAHRGAILEEMVRRAPNGHHLAFEPLPGYGERLQEQFPDVDVRPVALSDIVGELDFTVVIDAPAYSGFRGRAEVLEEVVSETIVVPVSTLDEELDPDLPVTLIKIDVEGAELGVLRGAIRTLVVWQPYVVFEHGMGGADEYGTTPDQVFELFAEVGLAVSTLDGWLAGSPPLTRDAFIEQYLQRQNYVFLAHPFGVPTAP